MYVRPTATRLSYKRSMLQAGRRATAIVLNGDVAECPELLASQGSAAASGLLTDTTSRTIPVRSSRERTSP